MNARLRFIYLSLVANLLTGPVAAATHVHVIHVDGRTPSGRPAIGATVAYALPNGSRVRLDTTDADGVATGVIDASLIGRTITLYIDGDDDRGGTFSEEKQITIKSAEEMEKGYVVTVVPTVGEGPQVADTFTAQHSANLCSMECPTEDLTGAQCYWPAVQNQWGRWVLFSNGQWIWMPLN